MGGGGQKLSKITRRHLWTIPNVFSYSIGLVIKKPRIRICVAIIFNSSREEETRFFAVVVVVVSLKSYLLPLLGREGGEPKKSKCISKWIEVKKTCAVAVTVAVTVAVVVVCCCYECYCCCC